MMTTEKCKVTGQHWNYAKMTKEQVLLMVSMSRNVWVETFFGRNVCIQNYQLDSVEEWLPGGIYETHFCCESQGLFILKVV